MNPAEIGHKVGVAVREPRRLRLGPLEADILASLPADGPGMTARSVAIATGRLAPPTPDPAAAWAAAHAAEVADAAAALRAALADAGMLHDMHPARIRAAADNTVRAARDARDAADAAAAAAAARADARRVPFAVTDALKRLEARGLVRRGSDRHPTNGQRRDLWLSRPRGPRP